jgi:hypothetical protein
MTSCEQGCNKIFAEKRTDLMGNLAMISNVLGSGQNEMIFFL